MIYFIRCADRIKIGFSENPKVRLSKISADAPFPCELLGAVEGDTSVEDAFHSKWAAHRAHGEWFFDVPAITDWIEENSRYESPVRFETNFCGIKVRRGVPKDLAISLGVSPSAISQWKKVPPEYCMRVADFLGIPAVELRPDIYTGWAMTIKGHALPTELLWRHQDLPAAKLDGVLQ